MLVIGAMYTFVGQTRNLMLFHHQVIILTNKLGVEPIAFFMVDRGRLVTQKRETLSCRYGCMYQHHHRGAMNLHELRCNLRTSN